MLAVRSSEGTNVKLPWAELDDGKRLPESNRKGLALIGSEHHAKDLNLEKTTFLVLLQCHTSIPLFLEQLGPSPSC